MRELVADAATLLLLAATGLFLFLVACGRPANATDYNQSGMTPVWGQSPDGRRVPCIRLYSSSISCDWD